MERGIPFGPQFDSQQVSYDMRPSPFAALIIRCAAIGRCVSCVHNPNGASGCEHECTHSQVNRRIPESSLKLTLHEPSPSSLN